MRGSPRLTTFLWLLTLSAAVLAWYRWAQHPYILDDAFISLRYAENLVAGNGLVYNVGEYVEGYTNFSWVLLGAVGIGAGFDAFAFVRFWGVASYLALFPVLTLTTMFDSHRTWWTALYLVAMFALLIVPPQIGGFSGTGMETPFVALIVLLFAWTQHYLPLNADRWKVGVGFVGLVMILTRPDLVVFLAASLIAHALLGVSRGGLSAGYKTILREGLLRYGVPVAGGLVFLGWKVYYYGDIFPNTFYAKQADHLNLRPGAAYLLTYLISYPQVVLLGALCLIPLRNNDGHDVDSLRLFALVGFLLHALYVLAVGGDFMEYRFMHHFYPVLVVAGLTQLSKLSSISKFAALAVGTAAVLLSTAPTQYEEHYHMAKLSGMHECCGITGVEYGKRLREILPPNVVISTTMAGGMPFYSKLTTIDQLGLNDTHIAKRGKRLSKKFRRGHMRSARPGYLRERGVNLIIGHPRVGSCQRLPMAPIKVDVFIKLSENRCLRSWYLNQTPELTRYFCTHPEDFVLRNLDCTT